MSVQTKTNTLFTEVSHFILLIHYPTIFFHLKPFITLPTPPPNYKSYIRNLTSSLTLKTHQFSSYSSFYILFQMMHILNSFLKVTFTLSPLEIFYINDYLQSNLKNGAKKQFSSIVSF